jgi:hypothetical protein
VANLTSANHFAERMRCACPRREAIGAMGPFRGRTGDPFIAGTGRHLGTKAQMFDVSLRHRVSMSPDQLEGPPCRRAWRIGIQDIGRHHWRAICELHEFGCAPASLIPAHDGTIKPNERLSRTDV